MWVDLRVAQLKVGDRFYAVLCTDQYVPMIVDKISVNGIISARYENNPEAKMQFNPNGSERGSGIFRYRAHVDTDMTFSKRTTWIGERERTQKAIDKIIAFRDSISKQFSRPSEKDTLKNFLVWLHEQSSFIEQAINDI